MRCSFLEEIPEVLLDHLGLAMHLRIPETLRDNSPRQKIALLDLVSFLLFWKSMLTPVQFQRDLRLGAIEIEHVTSDGVFSAELVASKATVAQQTPEFALRLGHRLAKAASPGEGIHEVEG
jgi:hypothetical protein